MDHSFSARPFAFDRIFSAETAGSGADEALLDAAALRMALKAERADTAARIEAARAEGHAAGLAEARSERDEALLRALEEMQSRWDDFGAAREAMGEALRHDAAELARAIGEALAARALALDPAGAIDEAIGRALAQVARGQEIVVTVHPDLVTAMEARIAQRQGGDRRRLNLLVEANGALAPGDAHLRWESGGLRLNAAERAAELMKELAALG